MKRIMIIISMLALPVPGIAQPAGRLQKYDISKDRVLYTIGYAHLDSEWNWEYTATINQYLKNTLLDNFKLFEKYPDYVFNFTGSRRYKMMKEYYPEWYRQMGEYIRQGRWFVSGSSVDEGEVNISSSESVIRQVLYGNQYFRREFNKESCDYMLPDCFGFAATLPQVWHHAGLLGFSTQKLSWGSANGIPFNFGFWEGPDGKGIYAALNATEYVGRVIPALDQDSTWNARLQNNINRYGLSFDYRYYGVGDVGGAPRETDVGNAVGSLPKSESKFKVVLTSSDQIYKDITPEIAEKLPTFSGDLLLTEHSAGSMTSQSFMKRANRKNEVLAKSAEQVAAMADWLGGSEYPFNKLANAWELILGSQFHDILPGTSTVRAYEYAWNDEFIASNSLSEILVNGISNVTSAMNTEATGRAIAVYNPVSAKREDIVTARLKYAKLPADVKVTDKEGKAVQSQIISKAGDEVTLIFLAKLPSAGIAVFDVQEVPQNQTVSELSVTENSMENKFLRVKIDNNGDIGIYDKMAGREVLSKPATLDFQHESPAQWPAWNMDWEDRRNPPIDYMNKDVAIKVVEKGPVRVAIEITKRGQNSEITQVVSLSAGEAGKILDVKNKVDWQSKAVSLKAAFPTTVVNEVATYGLNTAAVQRTTNNPLKFEVPGREWIDLSDKSNNYGVSILEDCKYGSDKPDNSTIRLTLMYTPRPTSYVYQGTQDWGIHEFRYGIYPHSGGWGYAETPWKGHFLNNPPIAFEVPKHTGPLGREISFVEVSSNKVDVMAFKKAEDSEYYIIRVNELNGKEVKNVSLSFPGKITDAYEVNGQEKKIGNADFTSGKLIFDMGRFAIRSFAVKFAEAPAKVKVPEQSFVELPYDADGFSSDNNRKNGAFENNLTYPAELVPAEVVSEDIRFKVGNTADGQKNVVVANGQKIKLPEGGYNKVYILAAATGDTKGIVRVGGKSVTLGFQDWGGFVGQHYSRKLYFNNMKVEAITPAFSKRDNIAWFASHRHSPEANDTYEYSYMYKYGIGMPAGTKAITLPVNPDIRIIAVTVAKTFSDDVAPLQLLYDDFNDNKPVVLRTKEIFTPDMKPSTHQKPLFTEDVDERNLPRLRQYLREQGLDTVIVKTLPSSADYADAKAGNNASATYFATGKTSRGTEYNMEKIGLNHIFDSQAVLKDTLIFDNGEGRILIDLARPVNLDRVNMYFELPRARQAAGSTYRSRQGMRLGQRLFSIWTSDTNPDVTGDPTGKGWQYAGAYSGAGRGLGGSAVSFIFDKQNTSRYIMIVTDGTSHGTPYLGHLDIFAK